MGKTFSAFPFCFRKLKSLPHYKLDLSPYVIITNSCLIYYEIFGKKDHILLIFVYPLTSNRMYCLLSCEILINVSYRMCMIWFFTLWNVSAVRQTRSGLQSRLYLLAAAGQPWASCITSLSLNMLICKMRIVTSFW